MTEVAAALIWEGDRFLACQRPEGKARSLLWEFVGGKLEPGETGREALVRECREELGITVTPGGEFMDVVHNYPDLTVHLTVYNAVIARGTPKKLEHNDIRWITAEETGDYEFCPADEAILAAIRRRDGLRRTVLRDLLALQDEQYRDFTAKLIPNIDPERIIGVRTPAFRTYAKAFSRRDDAAEYLTILPHRYLEENSLHASLIEGIRDYDELIAALDAFLPHVDNWATCDTIRPKLFGKHPAQLTEDIRRWLASEHIYTVRFGLGMLMTYYLDGFFSPEHLAWAAALRSEEYYLNMMIAWYFATALAKQYDAALPYLTERRLDRWTHNKTIQKAVESRRIPEEQKDFLRSLRWRGSQA